MKVDIEFAAWRLGKQGWNTTAVADRCKVGC